jgi:hypothetical protein
MITRKALQLFLNSNAFLQAISRQYDDQFARDGAKIGTSLKIRLPNDYTVRSGPTAVAQNTTENYTTLTVATQSGVDVSFSSVERTMSLDDFGDRVLRPMMNVLAGGVAADVMSGAEAIPNIVHAVDGSNNTVTPTASTWLQAGAILDLNNAPRSDRCIIIDPMTQARTVASLSGLFNNQAKIARQYDTGVIGANVLGFDWRMDQTVLLHTTGAYSTLATVNGANQTGTAITISSLAGPLKKGDIVTFAGCVAVNRVTKATTGQLRQFVLTADAATSDTTLNIYPAITPQAAGVNVAYQTVVSSPTNSGAVSSPINASEQYRKNFAFHPTAVTMVTADLPLPTGAVIACHREQYDGISLRAIDDYNSTSDQFLSRLDLLYGYAWVRPEWAVVIADAV